MILGWWVFLMSEVPGGCFLRARYLREGPEGAWDGPASGREAQGIEGAWPFHRTSSGVRLCRELEEPNGHKGALPDWAECLGNTDTGVEGARSRRRRIKLSLLF
jgi:hypothetical protein